MTITIFRNGFDFTQRFDNGVEGTKNIVLAAGNALYYGVPASLATLGYLLSFGYSKTLNRYAMQMENAPSVSIAIFETTLSVINPDAKFAKKLIPSEIQPEEALESKREVVYQEVEDGKEKAELHSLVMPFIDSTLESAIEKDALASRGIIAASFLALEIAFVIDYGIGLIAATFACLSGGVFPELNLLARASLKSDANIVKCFHLGILTVVDPKCSSEETEIV